MTLIHTWNIGLGNQFLSNIYHASIILHVVRCFEDSDIHHVDGNVNPMRDIETINTELLLKYLETLEKHISKLSKKSNSNNKMVMKELDVLVSLQNSLNDGILASHHIIKNNDDFDKEIINNLQLITSKKVLYVCHVNEDEAANGIYIFNYIIILLLIQINIIGNALSKLVCKYAESKGNMAVVGK